MVARMDIFEIMEKGQSTFNGNEREVFYETFIKQ